MAAYQYVYVMKDVTKAFPGGREGVRVGYLEQEPHLDPDLTVAENVELAFGPLKAALNRFNEISNLFAEPMSDDEMNNLLAEQAELQEIIDSQDGWELDRRIEIALDSVAWLEKTLRDFTGCVIVVTHDRYFLENVTNWILELERGRGYPFEGNYSSWLDQKRKRLQQEEKEETSRMRALAAESEWIQSSPKARQSKSKARIQKYEEMLQKSSEQQMGVAEIVIPSGPRLGGTETPDGGKLTIGETVKLGYVDQSRDSLDPNKTVWEEISGGTDVIHLGKRTVASRAYVGAFNFKGSDQQKRVGILSGGERNRVHLAKMLKSESNVILLDEPTNDLDVDTLRALEDALAEFAGCAVIISHDRWFLDRLATHILAFEGDSHVEWFEGNFQDYEADKRRRLGAAATEPHRVKYRPLQR
eukprot:gene2665-2704_t